MSRHPLRRATRLALAVLVLSSASTVRGQVYKCTDAAGKTTYADAPCDAAARPLKLPNDTKGPAAGPHLCAQLLDERRRLAAEADRDAKRGRAESADSANRRLALSQRYEERCAGIARSEPNPK